MFGGFVRLVVMLCVTGISPSAWARAVEPGPIAPLITADPDRATVRSEVERETLQRHVLEVQTTSTRQIEDLGAQIRILQREIQALSDSSARRMHELWTAFQLLVALLILAGGAILTAFLSLWQRRRSPVSKSLEDRPLPDLDRHIA